MNATPSPNWREPGKKLQNAIAAIQAESPRRDIRGRFVHQYSAAEITLRALRAYAPPQVEPPYDGGSAGCGSPGLTPANVPASPLSEPHPSPWRPINIAIAVTLLVIVFTCPIYWVQILAILYGAANAVVAWEGR